MFFIFLFSLELFTVFFLSRFVTKTVSGLFYRFTKKEHSAMYLMAILFFPGTLIHELSHYLAAMLLFVKVGSMEFVPKMHGLQVKLGSVAIGKTDPFRRALIGLAPLLVGLSILLFTVYYASHLPLQPWYLNILVAVFVVFETGNTMFSSRRDVEGVPALLLTFITVILVTYAFGIRLPQSIVDFLSSEQFILFMKQLCLYMLVPISIDLVFVLLRRLFAR